MHEEFITFTIVDHTKETKSQIEEFVKLLQNEWSVIENFSYQDQYHFILVKHIHANEMPKGKELN